MGVAFLMNVAETAQQLLEVVAAYVFTKRARLLNIVLEFTSQYWLLRNIGHPSLLTTLVHKNRILIVVKDTSDVLVLEIAQSRNLILKQKIRIFAFLL